MFGLPYFMVTMDEADSIDKFIKDNGWPAFCSMVIETGRRFPENYYVRSTHGRTTDRITIGRPADFPLDEKEQNIYALAKEGKIGKAIVAGLEFIALVQEMSKKRYTPVLDLRRSFINDEISYVVPPNSSDPFVKKLYQTLISLE